MNFLPPRDTHPLRMAPIDGLRALSILWVMGFHVFYFLGYFLPLETFSKIISDGRAHVWLQGHFAVDVFFVLSGFLIGSSVFKEHAKTGSVSLRSFYLRRFFRVVPIYLFTLGLYGVVIKKNFSHSWANVLMVNNLLPFDQQSMGWTWSLAIEEQFYLLFPLVLMVITLWKLPILRTLLGLLVLSFLIQGAVVLWGGFSDAGPVHPALGTNAFVRAFDHLYDKTHMRFGGIVCGLIGAWLHRGDFMERLFKNHSLTSNICLGVCGLGVSAMSCLPSLNVYATGQTPTSSVFLTPALKVVYLIVFRNLFAIFVTGILLFVLSPRHQHHMVTRFLSLRLWFPIAELSYGAYLIHPIMLSAIYSSFLRHHPLSMEWIPVLSFAYVTVTFAWALLFFWLIEKPCRDYGKRWQGFAKAPASEESSKQTV